MNYLTLEKVSKSFGEKLLFDSIDLTIGRSQKIALIAKNGTGKTSLLRLIAGQESPEGEQAKILVNKNIRIGYLEQDPAIDPELKIIDAALDSENEKIKAIKQLEIANLGDDPEAVQEAITKLEDLKAWNIETKVKEILGKLMIHDLDKKSIYPLRRSEKKTGPGQITDR